MAHQPEATTGTSLPFRQWLFAFSLVTSLFFTWGFSYGLVDVLNAHFQTVFGITKTQSTLLQVAYFGAYIVFAPIAGAFMKRFGYKKGIHLGLTLYSIGAIFFWPSAKFEKYGGFVGSTFVIGCGLSCLEVAANSYISVLGSPQYAAMRLSLSQGFQGVASFAGPLIASTYFFRGENATSLTNVQWVYLAVAGLGLALNILFLFCYLPEIREDTHEQVINDGPKESFWKQYRCILGFFAQTFYVGAQVAVASFTVNFLVEQGVGISSSRASLLFSFCQLTFTFGRFVGVGVLKFFDPALVLSFYGCACSVLAFATGWAGGYGGVATLFLLFFFESICYPTIFTLATKGLGPHAKRGSGLIVMGVGGGAWYPSMQAAVADSVSTRRSYLVAFAGFAVMTLYAVGLVITQAHKGGFHWRNIEHVEKASMEHSDEKASEDYAEHA